MLMTSRSWYGLTDPVYRKLERSSKGSRRDSRRVYKGFGFRV